MPEAVRQEPAQPRAQAPILDVVLKESDVVLHREVEVLLRIDDDFIRSGSPRRFLRVGLLRRYSR